MKGVLVVVTSDGSLTKWLKSLRLPCPVNVREMRLEEPIQHHNLLQVETEVAKFADDGSVVVVAYCVADMWFPFTLVSLEELLHEQPTVSVVARKAADDAGSGTFYPVSLKHNRVIVLDGEANSIDVVERALKIICE